MRNYTLMLVAKMIIVFMMTSFFDSFLSAIKVSYNSKTLNTFRFFGIITIYFLATYMKYYKERRIVKGGSEVDRLI